MASAAHAHVGLVGLGTMGRNLAANMLDHGIAVEAWERDLGHAESAALFEPRLTAHRSLEDLVGALPAPRTILLMVKSGAPVAACLEALVPLLTAGDVLADCGNSDYRDTIARQEDLARRGLVYLGVGLSGGAEGARRGPSIMAGGGPEGWQRVAHLFEAIAARYQGMPCAAYVGPAGAGHFVKMAHNAIEYGLMQLIAEAYHLLRSGGGSAPAEIADVFAGYREGPAGGYLLDSAVEVLRVSDAETGLPLIDVISDVAEQKGTGRWAAEAALQLGVPAPSLAAAVYARSLSADRARSGAQARGGPPVGGVAGGQRTALAADLATALPAAFAIAYVQGFALMDAAAPELGGPIDSRAAARAWRQGSIVRGQVLDAVAATLEDGGPGPGLLTCEPVRALMERGEAGWRATVRAAVETGVPVPVLASALSYWDSWRCGILPTQLIQGQRDYFGAHGFERTDRPGLFHGPWATS